MKLTIVAIFLSLSIPLHANIISQIKELLGLSKPTPSISIPSLPNVKSNGKQLIGKKRSKNLVRYSEDEAKNYNYSYIRELYLLVHKKKPTSEFTSKWLNVLGQGGSREGVYRSLVLDRNYLALENYNSNLNENTALFTIDFMERFLGLTLSKEKVLASSIYTISRSLIEKSLEIIDVLLMRPTDDVYDWYAVFSSELANDYPDVWSNQMRARKSAEVHKKWAMSVPDDYIKSEVIIKLNKVLRFLENK